MANQAAKLKRLAERNGLKFKDCGMGHLQVSGPNVMVNYWPESKRRTAFISAGRSAGQSSSIPHCRPEDVINLCLKNAEPTAPPKSPASTRRRAYKDKSPRATQGQVRHCYRGETPPWEFPGPIIHCASDLFRLEAYDLETKAAQLRYEAEAMDRGEE